MDYEIKQDLKKDISKLVDLLIQADSIREAISEIKKEIKAEYDLPITTITKVATILRKQTLQEEEEKWEELKELVVSCL